MSCATYYLFAFDSSNAAIAAQQRLKDLQVLVMPTLREISASCGISLRVPPECVERAQERIVEEKIENWHLYRIETVDRKHLCTQIREWAKS